ncbi:putative ABC transporter ATP-binding protein YxlF [Actinomadura rubteroloni]|uniref:Putative ABC transporter ATP-binding protein YxlF n=1 Tax=Actinomadura rubteroloni TaxID=1926885 RepID=A0A2P4UKZ9_9ACTN|nr:ABC transporter ATP-binding protein [Actinomadura rubteroloni]POM25715.1 putative ABC transporter ATP-binding protein YxlF [Actinomadura rubteroloni]
MTAVLRAEGLGKRYGKRWALTDCTLDVPSGHVVGLVGPNGAGKTTLLSLASGQATPSAGRVTVLGGGPGRLARVGFVAQDTPTYAGLTVAEHLRLGARLNPRWDDAYARERVARVGLDPARRAGRLSGGQRAQLALTLGLAKRPELLFLDEPVAALDPLARRAFVQGLMEAAAEQGISVVLSSHLVSDVERACDYLVVLVGSRVRLAGETDALLAAHRRLTGPPGAPPPGWHAVGAVHAERQSSYIARADDPVPDPAWTVTEVGLEDLVLAYMSEER